MTNKVSSFSTKTKDDEELVAKLKKQATLSGRSFSWIVLRALRSYDKAKTKAEVQQHGCKN